MFVASNTLLRYYEQLKLKYNVTVSPINGVDSEACYPSQKGGVSSIPCKSLGFALKFYHRSNVVFYLTDPNSIYYLDSSFDALVFSNGSDFLLIGAHDFQAVINCGDNVSLSFVNFDNIMFDNVRLIQCGAWHDSTSLDLSQSQLQMLKVRAALYFYNCTNITMNSVQVTNSSEAVGVVMYDVDGKIEVNKSDFSTIQSMKILMEEEDLQWNLRTACLEMIAAFLKVMIPIYQEETRMLCTDLAIVCFVIM